MAVLVFAKAPVPGLTKTRLAAHVGAEAAADIAAAAFLDLLQALRAARRRTLVALSGQLEASARQGELRDALAGCSVFAQVEAPFANRLVHAHRRAQQLAPGPLLQIGMDTPQVDTDILDTAEEGLSRHAAVLGLAEDGGWWGLGLHTATPTTALVGIKMSTVTTGAHTRTALLASGLVGETVGELATLRDVDDWADAMAVAAAVSGSRFAAAVARHCSGGMSGA